MCLMESNYRGIENFAPPVYGALTLQLEFSHDFEKISKLLDVTAELQGVTCRVGPGFALLIQ